MANGKKSASEAEADTLFQDAYKSFQERRARFENLDNDINESSSRIMKAMADLAEKKPEEFFGLKPSEREKFLVERLTDPAFVALLSSGEEEDDINEQLEGIVGQQKKSKKSGSSSVMSSLFDLLGKFGDKIDIASKIFDLIKDEKRFWFDSNKEDGDKAQQEGTVERPKST